MCNILGYRPRRQAVAPAGRRCPSAINAPKDTTSVADKRLRIVISMLRQFFIEDGLGILKWMPTNRMLADGLTKEVRSSLLHALMNAVDSRSALTSTLLVTYVPDDDDEVP